MKKDFIEKQIKISVVEAQKFLQDKECKSSRYILITVSLQHHGYQKTSNVFQGKEP